MGQDLKLGLLFAAIVALGFVLFSVIKKKLNIKYSIVWIIWSIFILVIALFPNIFYNLTYAIGIELPVHAIFLVMIALIYGLTFFVYIMISKHNNEIIQLTYEVAALKKEVEELKKK